MGTKASLIARTLGLTITVLGVIALLAGAAQAKTITQILDVSGDGAGNPPDWPWNVAVDGLGNVYVAAWNRADRFSAGFRIDPNGVITKIIDPTGDGAGNTLEFAFDVAADSQGNAYFTGANNVFQIDPNGLIRIVSLEVEGLRQYPGNYDQYLTQRAEEEIILENKAKNIAREREHAERFITRFD